MYKNTRLDAIKLRRAGWSYNVIVKKLGVSKSSLSIWLRDIPYSPNKTVQKRVRDGLMKTAMARHEVKIKSINKARDMARRDINNSSNRDLMMAGLGLYIGEGTKREETVHIMNSDPRVLKLAIKWLRTCFHIPPKHFRVKLHLYPDNDIEGARIYWSRISGIPLSQFEKFQVDRRKDKSLKNRKKLPHGTAHIRIRACGRTEFGVLLHRRIMALINELYTHTRV